MRDKRSIDEISTEELERILAIRRREERMSRFRRYQEGGRVVPVPHDSLVSVDRAPVQHEVTVNIPSPVEPSSYDLTQDVPRFDDEFVEEVSAYVSSEPAFIDEDRGGSSSTVTIVKERSALQKKVFSWSLLLLEVVMIGGLAIILYRAFSGLGDIQENTDRTQQELSQAIARGRATASPTPILSVANYVLPGGHTPPDENGQSRFNQEELNRFVPDNVRPAIERQLLYAPIVSEPQLSNDPVTLDVPAIGISNASIVGGDHWEALLQGIGHRVDSGRPGTNQNVVLIGHNDIYGEVFKELPELRPGDEIFIHDNSGRVYTYRVREGRRVEPTDVWVLDPNLGAQVTLITCYPYRVNTYRWVVVADLVK